MLKRLTETTRICLHEVEGDLWVPWAAAQQINAQQKVNLSIKYGLDFSSTARLFLNNSHCQRGL